MASTINVLTTGVGGIQQTGDTSGILQMQKDGTATLTIDTSGNVGIGTASPTTKLHIKGGNDNSLTVDNDGSQYTTTNILNNGTVKSSIYWNNSAATLNVFSTPVSSQMIFGTVNTERMRIGASGEIGLSGANYGTSGQFLTSNGPGAAASWTTAAAGGFSNMTVFTSPGTFTTPATTTKIKVTVVGGGGAGGGSAVPLGGGGGGGGGGTAIYVGPVTASTPYAVTVGTAGSTSSFGVLASATGGSGGSAGPANNGGAGGSGGAGSAGTLQFRGNGGTSGSSGNGNTGGSGGGSLFGGGANGIYANGSNTPGNAGGAYGGGGSGGIVGGTGGAGAAGVVVVEY